MKNPWKKLGKSALFFWAVGIFFNGFPGDAWAKCPIRMGSEFPKKEFLVIAHRGATTKFPENTLPAFKEALNVEGANALEVDLSLTRDKKIVLWHDWDPDHPVALIRQKGKEPVVKFKPFGPSQESGFRKKVSQLNLAELRAHYGYEDKTTREKSKLQITDFKDFIEWAVGQEKLKAVFMKLRVPADESRLAPFMMQEIKRSVGGFHPALKFQMVFMTPHQEVLNRIRNSFDDIHFAYDREIPPVGIVNYITFTTIPIAMQLKNDFAGTGLPIHELSPKLTPWEIYQHILTYDFKIRDGYIKSNSKYIKMISWTFNDPKKLWCLVHLGLDGIVTDKPELLRKIALELGKILD